MAYRNPRFYFHHALRSAGAAALGGSAFLAAQPLAYLYDSGQSRASKFSAVATNQYVKADRGAGYASLPQPNRLILASGHDVWAGGSLQVRDHTSDPPDGLTGTLLFSATPSQGLNVLSLSPVLSLRYCSFVVPADGGWQFTEVWLSVLRTTTRGPSASWKDAMIANQFEAQMRSGETYRLELGAVRRHFEFTYRALSGADLLVFTDMRSETRNGLYPMYVDPPDDSEPAILMQILGGLEFEQDYGDPSGPSGLNFKLTLRLLEVLA